VQRQGWVEGGFNGRTNKLVDGCYSFWQGGVFPVLQQLLQQDLPQEVCESYPG
jgi:protein farnesyltransferase subunit beta